MGKNVNFRRLEIFVIGSGLIGLGGAALITSVRIFDPAGFHPFQHTFLIWVMVLFGGAGSNLGAIFGAVAIYIIWTMSEPVTLVSVRNCKQLRLNVVWLGSPLGLYGASSTNARIYSRTDNRSSASLCTERSDPRADTQGFITPSALCHSQTLEVLIPQKQWRRSAIVLEIIFSQIT